MSQIVYTEIEATPWRWSYKATEPFDTADTKDSVIYSFNTGTGSITLNSTGTSSITLNSTSQRIAQKFTVSAPIIVETVTLYAAKSTTSDSFTLWVQVVQWDNVNNIPGAVISSGNTNTSWLSTTAANVTISVNNVLLNPGNYGIIIYLGDYVSGSASIYYGSGSYAPSDLMTSTNSGATWTTSTNNDLRASINYVNGTVVKTFTVELVSPRKITTVSLDLGATLTLVGGSRVYTGVQIGDGTVSYSGSTTTSSSVTYLSRSNSIAQGMQTIKIWGFGNGHIKDITYRRYLLYDVTKFTPRHAGFDELFLIRIYSRANGTQVKLNDKVIIALDNAQTLEVGTNYIANCRVVELLQGDCYIDFLGVE